MAEYASKQAMDDIEELLTLANRSGEWNPDHEPMLDRWRAARGARRGWPHGVALVGEGG